MASGRYTVCWKKKKRKTRKTRKKERKKKKRIFFFFFYQSFTWRHWVGRHSARVKVDRSPFFSPIQSFFLVCGLEGSTVADLCVIHARPPPSYLSASICVLYEGSPTVAH